MNTLDQLGITHQTDKASQFSRTYAKPHDYLRHLELFFGPLRNRAIKLLEIGVGGGESIQTWLDYFPQGKVFGVDMVHDTNEWNIPKLPPSERYTFVHGNQSSVVFWKSFLNVHGGDWDIIIDDGSHVSTDIITTFKCLWGSVRSGGFYEIEDLASAKEADLALRDMLTGLHAGTSEIDAIYFAKELCIMRKG